MTAQRRFTGRPTVEPPGDVPKCPGCGRLGSYRSLLVPPDLLTWWWETEHADDCPWMADPTSEAY